MSFLFPSFLYALGLIAIPVIIHFFNFQRAKRVYFTNVAFLKTVKEVTNSRNRLKHLLILSARMLFIAAAVLAFAQPFLPQKEAEKGAQGGNFMSIYLDNSYSMQQERDNLNLINWAVRYAEQLPKALPKQMRYQLLDNTLQGNFRYFYDADKLMDKLAGFSFSNATAPLDRVYERQLKSLANQATPKGNSLFWVSDFQKQNIPNLTDIEIDTAQQLYILPVSPNRNTNLYIDSIWLETPFVKVEENNFVNVRVSNHGNEDLNDRVVKLLLEGNQVSSGTVSLPAGGQEQIKLNFATTNTGYIQGRVSLEDYPMTFDNEHHFVLKVAPQINIVSIVANDSKYIGQVYANEPFFKVQRYSIQAVDYAAIASADLIVLQGLNSIDPSLQVPLAKALENGSSIAVFPGSSFNTAEYSSLAGTAVTRDDESLKVGVRAPDRNQPFFQGVFEQVSTNMSMPEATPRMSWGNMGEHLLTFKTGKPFLSKLAVGKGNLYLCASPLLTDLSNFAKHAVFVPTLYRIALSSKTNSERLSYSFDEEVANIILPDNINRQEVFKLKKGEFDMIPEQRVADGRLLVGIPKGALEAGIYEVRGAKSDELIGQVAFNYNSEESRLDYHSFEDIKEHFGQYPQVTVMEQVDTTQFAQSFSQAYTAKPLWRWFIMAALFFLLAEVILIRMWKD